MSYKFIFLTYIYLIFIYHNVITDILRCHIVAFYEKDRRQALLIVHIRKGAEISPCCASLQSFFVSSFGK